MTLARGIEKKRESKPAMNKATNLFFYGIVLVLTSCTGLLAQKNVLSSKRQESIDPVYFDKIPRTTYWIDDKVLYLITNDDENLYVHLILTEHSSIRSLLDGGLTVWIDANGKNKKKTGIQFPLERMRRLPNQQQAGPSAMGPPAMGERQAQPGLPNLEEETFEIELLGIKGVESYLIPSDQEDHINGVLFFNEFEELNYHVKIPYERLGEGILTDRIVSINIESGSSNSRQGNGGPGMGGGMNGMGGGMGMGGGPPQGGMGGGMGMGGGPGAPPSQGQQSDPIKIKLKKIKLVSPDFD